MNAINKAVYALLLIGALDMGLLGVSGVDVIGSLFGPASRIVYALIGVAALYSPFAIRPAGGNTSLTTADKLKPEKNPPRIYHPHWEPRQ